MILKKLTASKVFGYLNFNFQVNPDLSFLVGGNGSGKITTLKLINALLVANFKELISIPFEEVSLEIEHKGENIVNSAHAYDDEKTVSFLISAEINTELLY